MKKENRRGFTLIELLVVISIIALLSSIVMSTLNDARMKGRDARRLSDINQIQNALELYRNSTGYYPESLSALVPTYLPTLPVDPQGTGDGLCKPNYCYSAYFDTKIVQLGGGAEGFESADKASLYAVGFKSETMTMTPEQLSALSLPNLGYIDYPNVWKHNSTNELPFGILSTLTGNYGLFNENTEPISLPQEVSSRFIIKTLK